LRPNNYESQLPGIPQIHGTPRSSITAKKGITDPKERKEIEKRIKILEEKLKFT